MINEAFLHLAATTDARWLARQEAYALQRAKVEADARAGALERSHSEVGLKAVRMGGASKLGDIGLSRIAKCAPRLEVRYFGCYRYSRCRSQGSRLALRPPPLLGFIWMFFINGTGISGNWGKVQPAQTRVPKRV